MHDDLCSRTPKDFAADPSFATACLLVHAELIGLKPPPLVAHERLDLTASHKAASHSGDLRGRIKRATCKMRKQGVMVSPVEKNVALWRRRSVP